MAIAKGDVEPRSENEIAACSDCELFMSEHGLDNKSEDELREEIQQYVDFLRKYRENPKVAKLHTSGQWRQLYRCLNATCDSKRGKFVQDALRHAVKHANSRAKKVEDMRGERAANVIEIPGERVLASDSDESSEDVDTGDVTWHHVPFPESDEEEAQAAAASDDDELSGGGSVASAADNDAKSICSSGSHSSKIARGADDIVNAFDDESSSVASTASVSSLVI